MHFDNTRKERIFKVLISRIKEYRDSNVTMFRWIWYYSFNRCFYRYASETCATPGWGHKVITVVLTAVYLQVYKEEVSVALYYCGIRTNDGDQKQFLNWILWKAAATLPAPTLVSSFFFSTVLIVYLRKLQSSSTCR